MIVDLLSNMTLYGNLSWGLTAGLAYLREHDLSSPEPARIEIDGDSIFAIIQDYETRLPEAGKWEAHRRYWDIQYMVRGSEILRYANIAHLSAGEYVPEKDFLPLEGVGDRITLRAGMGRGSFLPRTPTCRGWQLTNRCPCARSS